MKISVSYLKSIKNEEETIKKINETSADFLHVDLMDGIFAGTLNFQNEKLINLLQKSLKALDIHLMLQNPAYEIEALSILNPKYITIHLEIDNLAKYLKQIKGLGIKAGLAINPDTNIKNLFPYLEEIDLILIMSVNPGLGGQPFKEEILPKLKELKKLKRENNYSYQISIDGGINDKTYVLVKKEVDLIVVGSFICMAKNYEQQIKKLK